MLYRKCRSFSCVRIKVHMRNLSETMRTNAGLGSFNVPVGIILFLGGPSVGNDMSSRWRPYDRDFTPPAVILRNKEINEFSTLGSWTAASYWAEKV